MDSASHPGPPMHEDVGHGPNAGDSLSGFIYAMTTEGLIDKDSVVMLVVGTYQIGR